MHFKIEQIDKTIIMAISLLGSSCLQSIQLSHFISLIIRPASKCQHNKNHNKLEWYASILGGYFNRAAAECFGNRAVNGRGKLQ